MPMEEDRPRIYAINGVVLTALLVAAVAVGELGLGTLGTALGLGIAGLKAVLVGAFFMHLQWSKPLMRVFACAAMVWLVILFSLTLADYLTRPQP